MRFQLHNFLSARLPLLSSGKVRVAQLTSAGAFQSADLFPPARWRELNAFAPNVLVGSAADLHRLVERLDLGTLNLDSIDHSICVLTDVGDKPLTDVLRVVLWQRFGVPVYELLTDSSAILAYECENHDGLHVVSGTRFTVRKGELVLQTGMETVLRTGLKRVLDSTPCPCGRPGIRVVEPTSDYARALEPVEEPVLAAIA
jgi:hypothetical protein